MNVSPFRPGAVSKVPSARRDWLKKSPSPIYKYKFTADYSWNRGGRLKELRRRFLARKFLALWKKKAFGRLLPSQAKQFVSHALLKKTFAVWKDLWWENRQEWRLEIRADCHYRFKTTAVYFRAWRAFVAYRNTKGILLQRAVEFNSQHCMRRALSEWHRQTITKLSLRDKLKYFIGRHDHHLLQTFFSAWKHRFGAIANVSNLDTTAQLFCNYRIQKNFFYKWQKQLSDKFFTDFKIDVILTERTRRIAKSFLKGLHILAVAKRHTRRLKARAVKFRHLSLLLRHYYVWTSRYNTVVKQESNQRAMRELARRAQLRRHFIAWKQCLHYRHARQLQIYEAEFLYQRTLKKHAFRAMHELVGLNVKKSQMKDKANAFSTKNILRRALRIWIDSLEKVEDAKLKWSFRLADKFRIKQLLGSVFSRWNNYANDRREKNIRNLLAVDVCTQRRLISSFRIWRSAAAKRRNIKTAMLFSRTTKLRQTFLLWKTALNSIRESRLLSHLAISFDERRLKVAAFGIWQNRFQQARICNEKLLIFVQRQRFALSHRTFQIWRTRYFHQMELYRDSVAADQYQSYICRKRFFSAWKLFVEQRHDKQRRFEWARNYFRRRTQRRVLACLQKATRRSRQVLDVVGTIVSERNRELLNTVFAVWRRQAIIFGTKKLKADLAYAAANRRLVFRCFNAWRLHTGVTVAKHEWQGHKIALVQSLQRKIILKSVLQKWRERSDSLIVSRLYYERASMHDEHQLMKRAFDAWRKYRIDNYRKVVLNQWAHQFCNVRITAKVFVIWRSELAAVRSEQHKSLVALWHWAFNLKTSVFSSWMKFVATKRAKHIAERDALCVRQDLLSRRAVGHWVAVADQFWSKQHISVPADTTLPQRRLRIARRYGSQWRENLDRRRNAKQQQRVAVDRSTTTTNVPLTQPVSLFKSTPWRPSRARPMPRVPDFLIGEVDRQRLGLGGMQLNLQTVKDVCSSPSVREAPLQSDVQPNHDLFLLPSDDRDPLDVQFSKRCGSCSPNMLLRPEDLVESHLSANTSRLKELRPASAFASMGSLITPDQLAQNNLKPKLMAAVEERESEDLRLIELKHRLELIMTMKCELSNLKVRMQTFSTHFPDTDAWQHESLQQRILKLEGDIEVETKLCRSLADECRIDTST